MTTSAINAIVIDDDIITLEVMTKTLNKHHISTRSFDNAEDAYTCLQQHHNTIDIVITDKMMTPVDGIELMNKIKLNNATANIPVVIQSGDSRTHSITDAYQQGVNSYITKPYGPDELVSCVHNVLNTIDQAT